MNNQVRATGGPYIARNLAEACKGKIVQGEPLTRFEQISTDSRDIGPGDLFIPLVGPTYDGHDFLVPALEAGARGSLISRDTHREIPESLTRYVLIQVKDTLQALSDLASAHRHMHPVPLITVTGSSGKTTVKEMIAAVLNKNRRPLVSTANYNNLIGLPMTVLSLTNQYDCAVLEAGINISGEMEQLSKAAKPNIAIITTVGPVHLAGLGSIENVAVEKAKIVSHMVSNGKLIIPDNLPYLTEVAADYAVEKITFGLSESADFRAVDIDFGLITTFTAVSKHWTQQICLKSPGVHNVRNALAAAAALTFMEIPQSEIAEILSEFQAPLWRLEMIPLKNGALLIRDCYNANPQSMSAAFHVMAGLNSKGQKLAILGDMLELGAQSEELHSTLGSEAAELGIDKVIYVGNFGPSFAQGYMDAGGGADSVWIFDNKDAAWDAAKPVIHKFDAILVKGSRIMKMEIIADRILEEN